MNDKIIVFEDKNIRRTWFNEEWWYVAIDIIKALTNSKNPSDYLKDMRRRDDSFKEGWGQIATPLLIETKGGKQKLNCVSTKGAFRLIQSIPSKRVEPFKMWFAELGQDRIDEIENPEKAIERTRDYYREKGYPKNWIDKRIEGINIRQNLTDEWNDRGVNKKKEYAILTNEIHHATFGKSIKEHKKLKQLKKQNVRDHMTTLELIFSMLGEESTTEITREQNSQGFGECFDSAQKGGLIAGNARKELEKEIGKKITSNKNKKKLN